jgi:hypothetical protein
MTAKGNRAQNRTIDVMIEPSIVLKPSNQDHLSDMRR